MESDKEVYLMCLDRLEGTITGGVLEWHKIKESLYEGILWEITAHLDLKKTEGGAAVMKHIKLLSEP